HRRLRAKLAEIAAWNNVSGPNHEVGAAEGAALGIVASGVAVAHAREAVPSARLLQVGMTHPLPLERIAGFVGAVERCQVVEEGDPYLADGLLAAGIEVTTKPELYRFGELDVARVRRLVAHDLTPEPVPARGKPPQLCEGCPHRRAFDVLRELDCLVAGDIGCYSLGALPPFEALDTCVCMGASIGVGLGMRHALPPEQARRVVSVIGDSTFMHSGLSGLVEMVYNPPETGHVVLVLDNGTTAMTGLQEHPGTGRTLDHQPAAKVSYEDLARAMGIAHVEVVDAVGQTDRFRDLLIEALASDRLTVIIARRPCLLAARRIRQYEREVEPCHHAS
ncbi:MAG: thiamine pyrophosphate-binding protein, partial [Armatimonadetes bacterium]|nr:thiamine pyrophosphate-binding protein [Armatimonadota bacterium]